LPEKLEPTVDRVYRKKRALTQEGLANAIEKSVDTITNIECGFSATRLGTAADIADVLGVPLADLFTFNAIPPKIRHHRDVINRFSELTHDCDGATLDLMIEALDIMVRIAASEPSETSQ
jgi:DNA-binding XRE family transcriptional regulator